MSVTVTIETPELTLSRTYHDNHGEFLAAIHVVSAIVTTVTAFDAAKVYGCSIREDLLLALQKKENS